MASNADAENLERRLLAELAVVGDASAPELGRLLGISQPAFSRLASRMSHRLLVVGRARATRYAARRVIDGVGDRVPIYEIDEGGQASRVAMLHALLPGRFYVEALSSDLDSAFYNDLPYFLTDLVPSGFLGRLVPRQHPELDLPSDVRLWSSAHALRYLSRIGWNLTGSLIVGDEAFAHYMANAQKPPDTVPTQHRRRRYPKLASDSFAASVPGSSAGGEQPKFLVSKVPGPTPVIVKFSPPSTDPPSSRQVDLLVAEHLAHQVLNEYGQPAAQSELLKFGHQVFLEVERFDRTIKAGRRGLLSLWALDAQFVGRMQSWSDSTARLAAQHVVGDDAVERVRWIELFGRLIANSDMHAGNLSFFARGSRVLGLAPVYDMLPSLYAGQQGYFGTVHFEPSPPTPADAFVWEPASRAALELWRRVASHRWVSDDFRQIARSNSARVEAWRESGRLLPVR